MVWDIQEWPGALFVRHILSRARLWLDLGHCS
jgi:hypothetical protein